VLPPKFSVVICTRNRPALFAAALDSVLNQRYTDIEIVVVNDGSSAENAALYEGLLAGARARIGDRLRTATLVHRSRGHGSAYTMNYGVDMARGEYVCFLDDDDLWIDPAHLERAAQVISHEASAGRPTDLYMTNQEAFLNGQPITSAPWLKAMEGRLQARGRSPGANGTYALDIEEALLADGFCHCNCLTVRRALFLSVGGRDESIRWESDHDLFLRLVDTARHMLHHPAITARHHVPDMQQASSVTTALSTVERRLWQVRVMDKASLFLKSPLLRAYGRRHKGYALKHIATELATLRLWALASVYAAQGLAVLPGFKWALFTTGCYLRRWVPGKHHHPDALRRNGLDKPGTLSTDYMQLL
jgi:glycosyltransferase involved in cell wall biosynthesis